MTLKDLTISLDRITEEAVEAIVKDFVRYDTEKRITIFTKEGRALPNKLKVLVFLVGQHGWQYILPDASASPAVEKSPQEISKATNIKGGTVRPLLKTLASEGLVYKSGAGYIVPQEAIPQVSELLREMNQ